MKNRREYGIKFRMDALSGIAAIVVYDKTDGQYVLSTGVKQTNYAEHTIDLYLPSLGYADVEKDIVYWISLEDSHEYDIAVRRTGLTSAPTGDANLNIVYLFSVEKFVDSEIAGILTTYHTEYPTDKYLYDFGTFTYPLTDSSIRQQAESLSKTQEFVVEGTAQSLFSLAGSNRASKFMSISINNGITWLEPYDISFVWGSNAPYYNDETISIDGYFSVLFSEAVNIGETVIIDYIPFTDRCYLEHTIKQPISVDGSYSDLRAQTRFMDYALEIIPKR